MTLDADDLTLIQRVTNKHINSVPRFEREFIVTQINLACKGEASYPGTLSVVNRRFGQRARAVAKKILDEILLEAAVPSETG